MIDVSLHKKILKYVIFVISIYLFLTYLPRDEIYWKDTLTIVSAITAIYIVTEMYFPSISVNKIDQQD